jgi:hypothetical protein
MNILKYAGTILILIIIFSMIPIAIPPTPTMADDSFVSISPQIDIDVGPNYRSTESHVAFDSTNNRFLVCYEKNIDDTDSDAYGQLVNADGSLYGVPIPIAVEAGSTQYCPKPVYNPATNQYLAVWSDSRLYDGISGFKVFGQLVNADGSLSGNNFLISPNDVIGGTNFSGIVLNTTENKFLVLMTTHPSAPHNLWGRFVNTDGSVSSAAFPITQYTEDYGVWRNALCYDSNNNRFLLAWGIGDEVRGRLLSADGTFYSEEFVIHTPVRAIVSIAFDPYNSRYLALMNEGTGLLGIVRGQLINADGTLHGSVIMVVSDYPSGSTGLTFDSTNQKYLVVGYGSSPVFGQYLNPDGSLYGSRFAIAETSYHSPVSSSTAFGSGDSGSLVVWTDSGVEWEHPLLGKFVRIQTAILGNVTNSQTSLPISNLRVMGMDYNTGEITAEDYTDDNGDYSLAVSPGSYRVSAGGPADGLNYVSEFYDNTYSFLDASPVEVTGPSGVQNINFSLQEGGTISGNIVDTATATPIPFISVAATDYNTGELIAVAFTDSNGNYSIIVPTGTYRVGTFAGLTGLDYVDEFYDNAVIFEEATPVSVTVPDDVPDIDFNLSIFSSPFGYPVTLLNDDLTGPAELDFDTSGNIYVANEGPFEVFEYEDFVTKLTPNGETIMLRYIDGLEGASGLVVDVDGNIYVSQNLGSPLRKYSSDGSLIFEFEAHRPDFSDPNTLALTDDGRLLAGVADTLDTSKWRILAFDIQTGNRLADFTPEFESNFVNSIVFEDGQLFIGHQPLDGSGLAPLLVAQEGSIPVSLPFNFPLVNLHGLDVGNTGVIYATSGEELLKIESDGSVDVVVEGFTFARGVQIKDDYLLVCDFQQGYNGALYRVDLPQDGTITGTVIDAVTSQPIANMHIDVTDYITNALVASADTDANGNYSLQVPPGNYKIHSNGMSNGLLYVDEYYDNTYYVFLAAQITVSAGGSVTGIDFSLEPGGLVSGTAVDSDTSLPIPNLLIGFSDNTTGAPSTNAVTDDNGNYSVVLPPGTYKANTAAWISGLPYVDKYYNNVYQSDLATPFTVTVGGNVTGIDFSLAAGGQVTGTVTDASTSQPISLVFVMATDYTTDEFIQQVATTVDGSYTMNLPAGTYRIRTNAILADGNYIDEYYDNTVNFEDATPVTITVPGSIADINFSLEHQKNTISGMVTDTATSLPIPNLLINVFDSDTFQLVGTAYTGPDGYYSIEVPSGTYRVQTASQATGLFYVDEFYDNAYFILDAVPVVITAGQTIVDIDFSLDLGGRISGTVTDVTTSQPIELMGVNATDFVIGNIIAGAITDNTGSYSLNVPVGTYRVRTVAAIFGLPYVDESYDNKYLNSEADPVVVPAVESTTVINFSLEPGGSLSGRVYDESGNPVAGAFINVFEHSSLSGSWVGRGFGVTNPDGTYLVSGLAPGTYGVQASAGGYATLWYDNVFYHLSAAPVTVTVGSTTPDINFNLPPGGTVSGIVTDSLTGAPLSNVSIDAERVDIPVPPTWGTTTDSNGYYTLSGLPFGQFKIRAAIGWGGDDDGYIMEYYDNKPDQASADLVSISSVSPAITDIDFTLEKGGTISGRVYDEIGNPVAGASVMAIEYDSLFGWWNTLSSITTDAGGYYQTSGLPAGQYAVRVEAAGYATEWYDDTYFRDFATPVDVVVDSDTPNIDFYLGPGGSISGYAYELDGVTPISNLHIYATDNQTNIWIAGVVTNADGSYTITGLPAGFYRVATASSVTGLSYVDEFFDNTSMSNMATPVPVIPPDNTPGIDFSLEAGGTISCTVTSENGMPVENAIVFAVILEPELFIKGGLTDSDGHIWITVPAPGEYQLHIFADNYIWQCYNNQDYLANADMITVPEGGNININVVLKPSPGSVSGTIYEADGITPISGAIADFYTFNGVEWILAYSFVTSNTEGYFEHPWVKPGEYKIKASMGGYVGEWYPEAQSIDDADIISIEAGGAVSDVTFTLSRLYETPPGNNITINDSYNGVTIAFDTVISGGYTYVVKSGTPPAPAEGFIATGIYYYMSSDAIYQGNTSETITYDEASVPGGFTEEDLRLFYWTGSSWEDVTILPVDTVNNMITGSVTSLGWFGIGVTEEITPPATVRLIDSQGNGVQGGVVKYYDGGWQDFGVTDVNGEVSLELLPKSYNFRMSYAFASIDQSQDVGVDPIVIFQTASVTVQLKDSAGNLMDTGEVKYYSGGWRGFGTTSGGEVSLELLPKSYNFRMSYAFASIDQSQDISADPVVVFQTASVTVQLKDSAGNLMDTGEVKYYSGGWRDFGITSGGEVSLELLPKSYNFRMSYAYASIDQTQDTSTDPIVIFQTASVTVQLRDSSGNPLDTGTVKYYSGGWRDFGATSGGEVSLELLPKSYNFRMSYAFASIDQTQDISADPVVVFQTASVTVQLRDSSGNPLDTGTVKYYSGGWRDFGITSGGEVSLELLPKSYNFRMSYAFASIDQTQDVGVDAITIFQTGQVVSDSETCASYYAGGWRTFINGMELLPGSYTFRFNDGNIDTTYDIIGGVTNNIH